MRADSLNVACDGSLYAELMEPDGGAAFPSERGRALVGGVVPRLKRRDPALREGGRGPGSYDSAGITWVP